MKLIEALRNDKTFMLSGIPTLVDKFNDETANLSTYVGTKAFSALTIDDDILNPINIIVRYATTKDHDDAVVARMIGAIETIAAKLVDSYDMERTPEQLDRAKYNLCRRVYDSSARAQKSGLFGAWEEKFNDYKIKSTVVTEETPAATETTEE